MLNGIYNESNLIPIRKIPGIWKKYGESYEQMSHQIQSEGLTSVENLKNNQDTLDLAHTPAGSLSNLPLKGKGTFQYEVDWSLGNSSERSFHTENKQRYVKFGNHNQKREAVVPKSFMPVESYANDFKTVKMLDQDASKFDGWVRPGTIVPKDSGLVYPKKPAHKFETTYNTLLQGKQHKKGLPTSGKENCCHPGYNIITGGSPLQNNPFEYWTPQDYRRRR